MPDSSVPDTQYRTAQCRTNFRHLSEVQAVVQDRPQDFIVLERGRRRMPGKVWVKVHGARDLPVMDKSADTTDAFVEIRFGPCPNVVYKTDICPKTLCPRWETDWLTFEAEDHEIQDESVVFKVMDYDTYSANDAIGRIYFDLNPLMDAADRMEKENLDSSAQSQSDLPPAEDQSDSLAKLSGTWTQSAEMTGWLPILDTLNGIRGKLEITIYLELFADKSVFRQSSCGVEAFSSPVVPVGFRLSGVLGLVDELLVVGDPEYEWLDKIRTPRATNEARQAIFRKLSNELVRKLGRKALALQGNAILGTRVSFDLEGQSTGQLVVRGLATAVKLSKISSQIPLKIDTDDTVLNFHAVRASKHSPLSQDSIGQNYGRRRRRSSRSSTTSAEGAPLLPPVPPLLRQASLDTSGHLGDSQEKKQQKPRPSPLRALTVTEGLPPPPPVVDSVPDALTVQTRFPDSINGVVEHPRVPELPFLTLDEMPERSVSGYGGVVCARSVRFLDDLEHKEGIDGSDVRCEWWVELREELKSHMLALACNAVVGYREEMAQKDGICILSGTGTAVAVMTKFWTGGIWGAEEEEEEEGVCLDCSFCHVAYSLGGKCFARALYRCSLCGDAHVPDLILATCEPPKDNSRLLPRLLQVPIVRKLVHSDGDELAKEISNLLPFVEHELHGSLLKELHSLGDGRNSIFSLRVGLAIGEGVLVAVATGTALKLTPLSQASQANDVNNRQEESLGPVVSSGRSQTMDLVGDRNAACVVMGDSEDMNGSVPDHHSCTVDHLGNTASSMLQRDNTGSPPRWKREKDCPPQLCLRIWKGPLSVSGSGERDILSQSADSGNLKTRIDWLLKGCVG